ncbi:MAG TPA: phosphate ABC transporter permease subunit PstC [Candidatus Angelobacter sp.]
MPVPLKLKVGKQPEPAPGEQPFKRLAIVSRGFTSQHQGRFADGIFRSFVIACAVSLLVVVGLILIQLIKQSVLSRHQFGFKFLTTSMWNPVSGQFGAAPFIYGTLLSSFLGLLIAVPLSLGTALFLTELCPPFLRKVLGTIVELLAAIPSVIYGLWGLFVLAPVLRLYVEPWLQTTFGWSGLFSGPPLGVGMLAAGIILAIMILPIVASVTREVILAVPRQQREAVLALGATRWETLRVGVLRNARVGIVGAVILGLGRAIGETMAVTMVIGNSPEISKSLLAPGNTLASVVALEFSEAADDLHLSSLIEVALVLFVITLIVNALARLLVWSVTRGTPSRTLA